MNRSFSSSPRALSFLRSKLSAGLALTALAAFGFVLAERHLHAAAALPVAAVAASDNAVPTTGQKYTLKLHHLHTGEDLEVVYRIGDTYIPSAIAKLNHFLRDHRTQDESHYDPREFDLLHSIAATLGKKEIDIVCGYPRRFYKPAAPDRSELPGRRRGLLSGQPVCARRCRPSPPVDLRRPRGQLSSGQRDPAPPSN